MKTIRLFALLLLCTGLFFSISSCAVTVRGDNGRHGGSHHHSNNPHQTYNTNPGEANGSHNNSNNPHNNNSTNPGKSKGSDKK